jgi:hypothetical protein
MRQHTSAHVSIRQHASAVEDVAIYRDVTQQGSQHTSAYVNIRQHKSAYVSIRQHTSAYRGVTQQNGSREARRSTCIRQHTSASTCIRQHTSAYVKHTSAYRGVTEQDGSLEARRSTNQATKRTLPRAAVEAQTISLRYQSQHASAYVSIRQHTSACADIFGARCVPCQTLLLSYASSLTSCLPWSVGFQCLFCSRAAELTYADVCWRMLTYADVAALEQLEQLSLLYS